MAKKHAQKDFINVRGPVSLETRRLLGVKQVEIESRTKVRPDITEVVGTILNEWAAQQATQLA